MFENRTDQNGDHYVVESGSGQLAHLTNEAGRQQAAVNLTNEEADTLVSELNGAKR